MNIYWYHEPIMVGLTFIELVHPTLHESTCLPFSFPWLSETCSFLAPDPAYIHVCPIQHIVTYCTFSDVCISWMSIHPVFLPAKIFHRDRNGLPEQQWMQWERKCFCRFPWHGHLKCVMLFPCWDSSLPLWWWLIESVVGLFGHVKVWCTSDVA